MCPDLNPNLDPDLPLCQMLASVQARTQGRRRIQQVRGVLVVMTHIILINLSFIYFVFLPFLFCTQDVPNVSENTSLQLEPLIEAPAQV